MIITISGVVGSGKSTVAKNITKLLDAQRIYVGGIRREIAREKGMTIYELNDYAKEHPETDVDVDKEAAQRARELEKSGKVVVVEGRTQFHFIPESLKIFMKADLSEAARRIWREIQDKNRLIERNEGSFSSVEEVKNWLEKRDENDAMRYMKYYQFDHRKEEHYDFIVDTTNITAQQAALKVLAYVRSKQESL